MLFAVHIGNNILSWPWELGGAVLAGLLVAVSAWRLREAEIPTIALMTAASFVSSSMHVPMGPASVHLLLNGLVGVLLGWRAGAAIFVGLLLQLVLLNHGGFTAIGVNTCVLTLPALFCWALFHALNCVPGLCEPVPRALLVVLACGLWFLSAVLALGLLFFIPSTASAQEIIDFLGAIVTHPATLLGTLAFGLAAAAIERRLENAPEFPLGLLIGEIAVLLTVALNIGVLAAGMKLYDEALPRVLLVLAVAHLPVAAVEGVIVGFTVGFLAKVKPELLGVTATRR